MVSIANPVIFACSPAGLNKDLLGYSKLDNVRNYYLGIAPMNPLYFHQPGGLPTFLERIIIQVYLYN